MGHGGCQLLCGEAALSQAQQSLGSVSDTASGSSSVAAAKSSPAALAPNRKNWRIFQGQQMVCLQDSSAQISQGSSSRR